MKVCKVWFMLLMLGVELFAQKKQTAEDIKLYLNTDSTHYFHLALLNQTWIRWNESNPGTTVLATPAETTFDIGLRRTRFQLMAQVTDRVFLYFQFGLNNFNRMSGVGANRKVAAFFHDAVCEYRPFRGNLLKLGSGLTIANGLSRFSQPSIATILTLDVPVFAQATVDQTDIFSRKLSIYARGQVGKIDYRFVLSDPFPVTSSATVQPTINATNTSFAQRGHQLQQQAYVQYQFFEKEGHATPYMTGTYLGKKKIFNLGSGIIYQPSAMWIRNTSMSDSIEYQDMLLWAIEVFTDLPINAMTGSALSAYLGYFNTNYGTNYIRTQAQMNPADGNSQLADHNVYSKGGNGWPMFGTGSVMYFQLGYLFKKDLLQEGRQLQPYISMQRNNFNALQRPFAVYNAGINYLIHGHKSKLSLDYQNRPVLQQNSIVGRRGGIIMQYQIFI